VSAEPVEPNDGHDQSVPAGLLDTQMKLLICIIVSAEPVEPDKTDTIKRSLRGYDATQPL
jgi:hypothetical protein